MSETALSDFKPLPAEADTHAKRIGWWMSLTPSWRAAFQSAMGGQPDFPTPDDLERLWQVPALRFAGPTAPYPNTAFELTDCSGVQALRNLEVLVITYHRLTSVEALAGLKNLKSLFVNNNVIQNLNGLESLKKLEQLYVQNNDIDSLEPLRTLTNLKELYVNFNQLKNLDGLTPKHGRALKTFFALPNEHLTDRAVMRFERQVGVRCRGL